jgi:ribosome-binding protein aMBF1 (putative translation factor)
MLCCITCDVSRNPTVLKRIMDAEGRRQSWLAAKVGQNQSEISKIVKRGLVPDLEVQVAIADALGRKVEELWPADHDSRQAAA